jgi:hypothetical protein
MLLKEEVKNEEQNVLNVLQEDIQDVLIKCAVDEENQCLHSLKCLKKQAL